MPVYLADPQTCTLTPVPDAGADNHISIDGSAANWSHITEENFLPGPKPGRCQTLIRAGNQSAKIAEGQRLEEIQKKLWFHVYDTSTEDGVYEFDQNRKTTVVKDDTLMVVKNQNVTVNENQEMTVDQNQTVKVNGLLRKIEARNIEEVVREKIYIRAGVELLLEGPGNGIIKIDSQGITIQGVMVKIN